MAKLQAAGIGETYLKFLDAYLEKRYAQVIVEGTASDPFEIHDTIFQGTVLGPPLWNLFFADVIDAAESNGGDASIFADDLHVFKAFQHQSQMKTSSRIWRNADLQYTNGANETE